MTQMIRNCGPFQQYVYEIASLLVVGVVGSNLRFQVIDNRPVFELVLDGTVLVTLNPDGYELHMAVEEAKRAGKWSNFLEGGPHEVALSFLRKLTFVGYECVYPDKLSQVVNPLPFQSDTHKP